MAEHTPTSVGGDRKAPLLVSARTDFHAALLAGPLTINHDGVASIADKDSKASRAIAANMIRRLGIEVQAERLKGQIAGRDFEIIAHNFLQRTFPFLGDLRCGKFGLLRGASISDFDQYEHLSALASLMRVQPGLKVAFGMDYFIKPDIVVTREPESDAVINGGLSIVDASVARLTSIRLENNKTPILHASISCKWTLRSDRAQNARSEALNLMRNRKGRLPHIVILTAEPMPNRIASLALGTGDIDCVYHVALSELRAAVAELAYDDALELLDQMIDGKRLRDISDLPLDLTI